MKWISIVATAVQLGAFLWLVVAVSLSSRPTKAKRRAVEFAGYLLAVVILTLVNVPSATVAFVPGANLDLMSVLLSALRTLIYAVVLARLGVICLKNYAEREAMRAYILKNEQGVFNA